MCEFLFAMEPLEYRILDGGKLRQARGNRTLAEVCEASGKYFSDQRLSLYERGLFFPKPLDVPRLLAAYSVTWEQVSSPVQGAEVAA